MKYKKQIFKNVFRNFVNLITWPSGGDTGEDIKCLKEKKNLGGGAEFDRKLGSYVYHYVI